MPRRSTAASEAGTSLRVSGVMAPRSMRPMRSSAPLGRPGISKGVRPASSVCRVAASEKTSERTSGSGRSANISGGDHGTLMPTDSPSVLEPPRSSLSVVVIDTGSSTTLDEMPKSVSAGHP